MNINILMIALGVTVLGSCSTAYKGAQTPDDLYYSAPKEVIVSGNQEYLSVNNREERYSPNRSEYNENPDQYETYRNDRWLRMSIGRPYYLNTFNNYYWNDWGYSSMYGGGFNHGYNNFYGGFGLNSGYGGYNSGFGGFNSWNNPFGSSMYWNSFYNPYAFNYNPHGYNQIGIIPNNKPSIYRNTARPTVFNRDAYSNNSGRSNVNTSTRNYYNPRTGTYSNYSNTNNGNRTMSNSRSSNTRQSSSNGGTYYNTNNSSRRDTNTPSSNSSSDGRPQRSYTPAPTPSPSNGNSGGSTGNSDGGGGVRRPTRN